MRELQLVGYTADLLHLVFTDAAEGGGRFKAPIDEDFVSTLTEVLELVDPDTVPLGSLMSARQSAPAPESEPEVEVPDYRGNGEASLEEPRGVGPIAGMAVSVKPTTTEDGEEPASDRPRPSKLAPREIQALLRAGQGTRSVAKLADTDEWWVRRWLPPIEAERDQVLQGVWSSFVGKTRLGLSAEPVGDAVERNLTAKGVSLDDPSVEWIAARREGDPHWKVTLRYRSRGRAQRATWHFNPENGTLDPRNDLAVDIAWTRTRKRPTSERSAARRPSTKRAGVAKRTKTGSAKNKKSTAKKAADKKTSTGQKAAGKKTSTGKKAAGTKTSTAKKSSTRKAAGKKAAGKKTSTAKKSSTRKAAAKKAAGTKSTAKKESGRKAAGRGRTTGR